MLWIHALHCDDHLLERLGERSGYQHTVALVDALCAAAERQGQRLSLFLRWRLAETARRLEGRDCAPVRWAERGHEIAAHTHGHGIGRTLKSLRALGLEIEGICPGMIGSTPQRWRRLARACRDWGLRWICDESRPDLHAQSGQQIWSIDSEARGSQLGFIGASVDPWTWGILEGAGPPPTSHQPFGLEARHLKRLRSALHKHRQRTPEPSYFLYAHHDHQHLLRAGSPELDPESIQRWEDFLREGRAAGMESSSISGLLGPAELPPARSALPAALRDWAWRLQDQLLSQLSLH